MIFSKFRKILLSFLMIFHEFFSTFKEIYTIKRIYFSWYWRTMIYSSLNSNYCSLCIIIQKYFSLLWRFTFDNYMIVISELWCSKVICYSFMILSWICDSTQSHSPKMLFLGMIEFNHVLQVTLPACLSHIVYN